MMASIVAPSYEFKNLDNYNQPIVLHQLIIIKGIQNNKQYGLQQQLQQIFTKYGKVWAYEISGKNLVFIGFDNEDSRDAAVDNENNKTFMGQTLHIGRYFSKLYAGKELIALKLKHPDTHINVLQNCLNFWNQTLYPESIVEEALKNGTAEVRVTAGRFNILYHHKDIGYPFILQMASEKRMKQHIICVRPQNRYEIAMMLQKADLSLLKQVLTQTNQYQVDWRYYKLWKWPLLTHFAGCHYTRGQTYDKMKYMIDVIKCDPTDPRYELLHNAANGHNLKLVDMCLYKYNINPLSRNARWNNTALDECNYAWSRYQKKAKMGEQNIVRFEENARESGEGESEIKEENSVSVSYDDVFIKSILLSNFLYVQNYGSVCFCNVAKEYKEFAKFSLQCVGNDRYLIKVKVTNNNSLRQSSHARIRSLMGNKDVKSNFILTANIAENDVGFVPEKEDQKVNDNQCWVIQKQIKGNDSGYSFSVNVKGKRYQLMATEKSKLQLEEVSNADQDDGKIEDEGSDFNDTIKSWFIVLKDHEFEGNANYEWQQTDQSSALQGDLQSCQRIHDMIVKKLEDAMRIEKLHGNTMGGDDGENKQNEEDENKPQQKYKAKKVVHSDSYNHKYPTPVQNGQSNYGVIKKWNDMKGYGFIAMNDGSNDVFVHKSEIQKGQLHHGMRVEFDIVTKEDGRRKAVNVNALQSNSLSFQRSGYNNGNGYSHKPRNTYNNNGRFGRF